MKPDITILLFGRWFSMDYFGNSPYIYALNTPIQAIDPDGNLVIFINGMHTGDGGKPDYWRGRLTGYADVGGTGVFEPLYKNAFDLRVMAHLNDYKAIYRDGAVGGIFGIIQSKSNTSVDFRYNEGRSQGKKDAKMIIDNLVRDKNGNITESIKVITHSMGGAYGKGYIKSLLEYAKKNNIQGVSITFEADFAPFQPNLQKALKEDGMGETLQFSHSKDRVAGNKPLEGAGIMDTSSDENQGHSLFDFINQIQNLPEGTYKINETKIIIQ